MPGPTAPLRGEAALQHVCDADDYGCAGFLWCFQSGGLSGDPSHEQVKYGLRFFTSHVKPDLLKNKTKKKTLRLVVNSLEPLKCR